MYGKKKGVLSSTLVVMIVFLAASGILLLFTGQIQAAIKGPLKDQPCIQTALLESLSKKASVVGQPLTHLDCPQHFLTVALDKGEAKQFEKDTKDSEEVVSYIDKPLTRSQTNNVLKWYGPDLSEKDIDVRSKTFYREYRLNEIMAQEMKSCWNRLGQGKLNLFSDWFSVIKYEPDTFSGDEGFFSKIGKVVNPFNKDYVGAPKVCVVCSRVRFSEDVQKLFPEPVQSLTDFTLKNPTNVHDGPRPLSYYEFLLDDVYKDTLGTTVGHLEYTYTTQEDMAIVFSRSNVFYLVDLAQDLYQTARNIWGDYEEDKILPVDGILLVPYAQTATHCNQIVN